MDQFLPELIAGGGVAAFVAALWGFLRSPLGKRVLSTFGKLKSETAALRDAVENLSTVVAAQGESIDWLRTELDRTRDELAEAREALASREGRLESENEKLRSRVAELELQVKALESALAQKTQPRRRKNV
jgi:chromosome segregation ATPase